MVVTLLLCSMIIASSHIRAHVDTIALEQAAHRVGVTPTAKDIVDYLETSIHRGMSRERVELALQRLAPVEVLHRGELQDFGINGQIACDRLLIKINPFGLQLPASACYDANGRLTNFQIYID